MDYTLAGLRETVKDSLGDQEYSDESIDRNINFTQFEILGDGEYPFLERIDELLECRGGEMSLPRDFQTTLRVIARSKNGRHTMKYVPFRKFESGEFDGLFTYTMFGGKMFFHLPKIDPNTESDAMRAYESRHFYLAKVIPLKKDSDKPVIPYEYGEALVLGAMARSERRRDNFDVATDYENKMGAIVENMRLRYGPRQSDQVSRGQVAYRSFPLG
jgi:hypothetical protein